MTSTSEASPSQTLDGTADRNPNDRDLGAQGLTDGEFSPQDPPDGATVDRALMDRDIAMMMLALEEARIAASRGDVPIGAVVVAGSQQVVAAAHNQREQSLDPTAHAEILALRRASLSLSRWRLVGTTVYVTLEPCPMCAGALVNARVDRLVYGATDPKGGAIASLFHIGRDTRLNHRLQVTSGVLAAESRALLRDFFQSRR